jgi:anti-sigma regulatory factor (Ser/Thr protein kinase)
MTIGVATHTSPTRGPGRKRAAGRSADAAEDVLSLRLRGAPDAAADARRALANMRGGVDAPTLENLRLLVTELIANSVEHARAGAVCMKVAVGARSVLVEVTDGGPGFEPVARYEGQDDTSGWGLFLVERLSQRWGVSRKGGATRVWFELARA